MIQVKELLASNIKTMRKKRGFSQEKLAEITDLSTQSISDIEGRRTWVSDKTLEKLAKAFDVGIYQFFLPVYEDDVNKPELLLHNELQKIRNIMKEDVDKRLDQFYLSVKTAK
jgi:transcriptional regulator with XRE-family HTH domain